MRKPLTLILVSLAAAAALFALCATAGASETTTAESGRQCFRSEWAPCWILCEQVETHCEDGLCQRRMILSAVPDPVCRDERTEKRKVRNEQHRVR